MRKSYPQPLDIYSRRVSGDCSPIGPLLLGPPLATRSRHLAPTLKPISAMRFKRATKPAPTGPYYVKTGQELTTDGFLATQTINLRAQVG